MDPYLTKWIPASSLRTEEKEHLGGLIKVGGGENSGKLETEELRAEIQKTCNELAQHGYEVISILPVDKGVGVHGAYGHSITAGIMITAKRKE